MRNIAAKGAFLVGGFQTRVACQDKIREGKGGEAGALDKVIFRKAQSRGQTSHVFINHLSKKRCSFSIPPLRLKCLLLFNIHKCIVNSLSSKSN